MSAERVRIVVGEGRSSRQGLLRSVLTGEGYDVVGEATNPAELARVLAVHKPAVVVLDDGIGATSVAMVKQMLPAAKVVLIWPGDVVPIGGAIKVEPDHVRQELGPAVERLTGVAPESAALKGPAAEPIIEDLESAPVVILPVTPNIDDEELVLRVPDADESSGSGRSGHGGRGRSRRRRGHRLGRGGRPPRSPARARPPPPRVLRPAASWEQRRERRASRGQRWLPTRERPPRRRRT